MQKAVVPLLGNDCPVRTLGDNNSGSSPISVPQAGFHLIFAE